MADSENRVRLISPDGEVGSVPESSLSEALAQGYRGETEKEKAGREMGPVGAATVGAVEMLPGASALADEGAYAITELGPRLRGEKPPEREGLSLAEKFDIAREQYPVATALGGVAGGALTLTTTGAAGLAQAAGKRLIGKAAESMIGRAAQSAVQQGVAGALEGGLLGANRLITEEELGNAEYNAESIISHVGVSSLLGAGFGSVFGAGSEFLKGGSAKIRKVVEKRLQSQAKEAAEETSTVASVADEASDDVIDDVVNEVVKTTKKGKDTVLDRTADAFVPGVLELSKAGVDKLGKRYGKKLDKVWRHVRKSEVEIDGVKKRIVEAGDSIDDVAPKLRQKIDQATDTIRETTKGLDSVQPDGSIDGSVVADEIDKFINEKFGNLAISTNKNARDNLTKTAQAIRDRGMMTFEDVQTLRREAGKSWRRPMNDDVSYVGNRAIERILKKNADETLDGFSDVALGKGWKQAYKDASRDYHLLAEVTSMSENKILRDIGGNMLGLTDQMYGAAATAGRLAQGVDLSSATLQGLAISAGMKEIRKRSASIALRATEWASKHPGLTEAAERISKLDAIASAAAATEKAMDNSIKALMAGRKVSSPASVMLGPKVLNSVSFGGEGKKSSNPRESAKRIANELSSMANDPSALSDRLSNLMIPYKDAAPGHVSSVSSKMGQIIGFLNSKAPRPPGSAYKIMSPKVDDWQPSKTDTAKFARYVGAAMRPIGVIEGLSRGEVSSEGVEVLKELYPQIYDYAQRKLLEAASERSEPMKYSDRVNLSILFGVPLDETMDPKFLSGIQGSFKSEQSPAQGRGGGGTRLTGLDDVDPAKGMGSRSSEMLAGEE